MRRETCHSQHHDHDMCFSVPGSEAGVLGGFTVCTLRIWKRNAKIAANRMKRTRCRFDEDLFRVVVCIGVNHMCNTANNDDTATLFTKTSISI